MESRQVSSTVDEMTPREFLDTNTGAVIFALGLFALIVLINYTIRYKF
jgi:hypothetical protein